MSRLRISNAPGDGSWKQEGPRTAAARHPRGEGFAVRTGADMQPVIYVGGLTALAGTKGGGRRAFTIRRESEAAT